MAQYHHCARILAQELDVEPMPETRRLYERIQAGEARAAIEKNDRSAA